MREPPILSAVVFIMALGLIILGLVAVCAPPPLLPLPLVTPTITATAMPSPTDTPMPTNVPSPTETPKPHVHTPVPITETSSVTLPVVGGSNFASLQLPPGTTVVVGAASDGTAYPYNFYWAPTHEVVLVNEQQRGTNQEVHELCHAHQHWSINGGTPLPPSDYDLESWYGTSEGQSFTAAVRGLSFPWQLSAVNGLEDFAWTCSFWYRDSQRLLDVGGDARYEWAKGNLP
ncbi:hypothetical protein LCGC14_1635410 [marine sediment metagenome]|uniref:Uncharacterized protein n=1 Tax=marine sediment metagenome TaxID=412755 RepID=A0A0F9I1D0_9ZZZZ